MSEFNNIDGFTLDDLVKAPVVFLEFLYQNNLKRPDPNRLADLCTRMMTAYMEQNSIERSAIIEELMKEIGFTGISKDVLYEKIVREFSFLVTKTVLMVKTMGRYAKGKRHLVGS